MEHNQNAAVYFVDRHINEGRAEKVAYREYAGKQREITYRQLAHTTGQIASAFNHAGIRREERVAVLVLDQIEFVQSFFGAFKAGVVPIALNTLLATPVYQDILLDSRSAAVIVSEELYDTLRPAIDASPFVRKVIVVGDNTPEGCQSFDEFIGDAEPAEAINVSADDTAFWLYSSGSTGKPKGVRHVHGSMQYTADTYGQQVLQIQESDVVYSAAKFFFAYGLGNAISFPLSVGATVVIFNGRPTPDVASDILATQDITVFCGVPTLYAAMLHYWESHEVPEPKLRTSISAGEALPAEVGNRWKALMGTEIMDGVGSTVMLHIFLSNAPGNVVYGTSGIAVPGYQLRLVDENNEDVGKGEVGELLVNGDSAADGYWNNRAKSRTTFEGEWTRTGDKYELREDGRFVYCGRTDDMFKVSGIWVSPFEVEQALMEHPAVLEAAVVAQRDDDELEKPKAYIVLKDASNTGAIDELKEFVKTKVGKWKYPRWFEVVDDLPKTATGKIQRFKLRG